MLFVCDAYQFTTFSTMDSTKDPFHLLRDEVNRFISMHRKKANVLLDLTYLHIIKTFLVGIP